MDFLDLLRYNRETSVALMEVFCSPLKLILADAGILSKLHTALPRKIHFSQRFRETLNKAEIDDLSVDGVISDLDLLAQDDKFDKTYNGFKLLPKKLSPDLVDPLKWQAILRATLLRLDPVQQARRATLDVMTALKADSDAKGSVFLPSTLRKAMISGIGAMKTPMKTSIRAMDSLLSLSGSDLGEISSTSMSFLQTPTSVHQSGTHEVSKYLDKDAIFGITGDVVKPLETVVESCIALESYELHELGMAYKLAILQVLCDACYETQRIRELLEKNAEERLTRIQNMNKVSRETKEKKREEASALKDLAIQRCREINEAAAKKAEAEAAAKAKSKKGSKKGNKKKKAEIVSKKGGKNGKVSYDPTPQQLAAMLEDLIVLEALQIEEVVPDFPQEEVSDDEDDSDAEFDAIRESIRDESTSRKGTSGNLWDTERGRIKSAALRARSNDKKKARVEKRGRNLQLSLADEKLELALSTTSERDIRQALRFGEKIGLRGVDPVTKCTFCTEKMKQVFGLCH